MKHLLACLAVLLALFAPIAGADVEGRWSLELPLPGVVELDRVQLDLSVEGEQVSGTLSGAMGTVQGAGTWDPATQRLEFTAEVAPGYDAVLRADLSGDELTGTLAMLGSLVELRGERWSAANETEHAALAVDLSIDPPVTVSLPGLPGGADILAMEAMERVFREQELVGLSVAIAFDGKLLDVRSMGWEDFPARTPATGETMYRWGSIAKCVTAVVALQLVEQGNLDLDADVRQHVPEFPEQEYLFTSRQLLGHQAGIVHYPRMGLRTVREYDVEHPWTDPIIALDMFNERPLLFEPGTEFHYTTPGFVILGAVVDRAGDGSYVEQVTQRICEPLGMRSMQPDRDWVDIKHRSRGYIADASGRVIDSGTDNICWKLAAGGWISTVGDLARFGSGLLGEELLKPEARLEMGTEQLTRSGGRTGYGLGIRVGEHAGLRTVSHGGAQKKASTFLLVCPEARLVVAVMCNTQGKRFGGLAEELLVLMLRQK